MTDVYEIYLAYPRHVAKRAAMVSIENAIKRIMGGECGVKVKRGEAVTYLLSVTKEYAASFAGQRGSLTPHPTTWFNQARYTDDPQEWQYCSPEEQRRLRQINEANVGVWKQ